MKCICDYHNWIMAQVFQKHKKVYHLHYCVMKMFMSNHNTFKS